jgi:hypothetical protein
MPTVPNIIRCVGVPAFNGVDRTARIDHLRRMLAWPGGQMNAMKCVITQLDTHAHVNVYMQAGLHWARCGELTVKAEDLPSLRSILRSNGAQTVEWDNGWVK